MQAISVWNPWAWLIANGKKRIETRPWRPPAKLIWNHPLSTGERVAIHAAKTWPASLSVFCQQGRFRDHLPPEAVNDHRGAAEVLGNGNVIATCIISYVFPTEGYKTLEQDEPTNHPYLHHDLRIGPTELAFGDYRPGRFAWVLDEIERLDQPFPQIGSQRFFTVTKYVDRNKE